MINFKITIDSTDAIRVLDIYRKKSENLNPLLKLIKEYIQVIIEQHFATEQGSGGTWIKSKRALREGNLTLTDKTPLRESFKKEKPYQFLKKSFWVFTDLIYGATHQYGLTVNIYGRKKYKFHKRDFIWLSEKDVDYIEKLIIRYYEQEKVA